MKRFDYQKEKRRLYAYFILMCVFGIGTLVGGILVLRCHYNALFSLAPAVGAIVFSLLCKGTRLRIRREANAEPFDENEKARE